VLNRCNTGNEPCDQVIAWGEQPATVDGVRSRLRTLTAGTPVVRPAGPADPGVPGSVVFGVLIGEVCVFGHQRFNKDPDRVYAAGKLRDGACL
jgi:hypothetical protein